MNVATFCACDIITNIKHLLKLRNIKHTAPQQANKTLNDKNDSQ
jgi:hypothetical protein